MNEDKKGKNNSEYLNNSSNFDSIKVNFSWKNKNSKMKLNHNGKMEEIEILDDLDDDYSDTITDDSFDKVTNASNKNEDIENSKDDNFKISDIVEEEDSRKKKSSLNKIYISFETRVGVAIFFIFILFLWACILILQAMNFGKKEVVTYSETSKVDYSVCVTGTDYYANTCLDDGMEYVSMITDKIKANFKYNVDFSTNIDYDLSYHVVAVTRIYDGINSKKLLYEDEDLLINKTKITGTNRKIDFSKNVDIDFKEKNNFVTNYRTNFSLNASASLEVIMYLDEPSETRKVASIVMPLGNQTFGITPNIITNQDKSVEIDNNIWNEYNITCAIIGTLLIIVALLILFRLTRMVLSVTTKRSEYQKTLSRILRDYDRIIVIARNGFVTTREKAITKVDSFNELLDARNALNKPIVYSRINDIKSEFIVEDDDRLYKYVMKEADFSD